MHTQDSNIHTTQNTHILQTQDTYYTGHILQTQDTYCRLGMSSAFDSNVCSTRTSSVRPFVEIRTKRVVRAKFE